MSPMTKKEIRLRLKVSERTMSTWLNRRYIQHLEPHGYEKRQKLLTGCQVAALNRVLDFME